MLAIADVDDCARVDFVRNLPVDGGRLYAKRSAARPHFGPCRNTSGGRCVLFAEALGLTKESCSKGLRGLVGWPRYQPLS
jgi:hypothetical protein